MKEKIPTILTVAACAAIFLAVILVCFSSFGNMMNGILGSMMQVSGGGEKSGVSGGLDPDPNAQSFENSYYLDGSSDSIAVPGYERLVFKAGQKEQDVLLFNPEKNNCFFVIELIAENGKTIYRSGLIEPSKAVYKLTLSEALEAGSYGAVLRYSCYAMQTLEELNGAEVKITLEVS